MKNNQNYQKAIRASYANIANIFDEMKAFMRDRMQTKTVYGEDITESDIQEAFDELVDKLNVVVNSVINKSAIIKLVDRQSN